MSSITTVIDGTMAVQDTRVAKRQKVSAFAPTSNNVADSRKSRIFAPFRTVGLVSPTSVPFSSLPLGKTTFQITTSIGRSLQTYDLTRGLHLLFITSPQTPEQVTATVSWERRILAAWGQGERSGVWVFQRGKKVDQLEMPAGENEEISHLVVFGSWIVGCRRTTIEVWKSATLEHYTTIYSRGAAKSGGFTGSICTMPTYLNKIFAGKEDGSVEIWNVSTGKLLYTLLSPAADYGSVTALQPTPALSILAIAYSSGPIAIRDISTDKEILSLDVGRDTTAAVTTISFRTDGLGAGEDGRKAGVMATASSSNGDVTFWDLNGGGRRMGVLRGAHSPPSVNGEIAGGITKIEFLAGQAVLLTSGMDNALKTWIFDDVPFSPIPRILHSRGGHSAPVSTLQFLPTDADGAEAGGKWLLSTSNDRSFWGWSLRRDGQSTEISQGNIRAKAKKYGILNSTLDSSGMPSTLEQLKAPKITCIACSLNRDGGIGAMPGSNTIWTNETKTKNGDDTASSNTTGWESVVTGHDGDKFARTWFWGRKRAGRWKFQTGDGLHVKSVAISACGTFALVGSSGGGLDMFNLQSGIHRQRFPPRLTPIQAKRLKAEQAESSSHSDLFGQAKKFARGEGKHTGAVTGIVVDSLNKIVISCGEDGKVKFWDFAKGLLLQELDWSLTSIRGMRYHRASDLIAMSCDDGSIRVVDSETRKLVRELWGAKGNILDFIFSNDGRWILAASSDSCLRVYDLATGHLIEALRFRSQPVAIAFSNTGEYLATAHEDSVGVHIWTNRTLFTHVPTRQITPEEIFDMDGPTASGEGGEGIIEGVFHEANVDGVSEEPVQSTIDQLSADLLTLSLVPKARWQTLLHLDTIRTRNKPKEPVQKPKAAPFFLPSVSDTTALPAPDHQVSKDPAHTSRISRIANPAAVATTAFTALLHAYAQSPADDLDPLLAHLASLPPSAADMAIRTLDPAPPYAELVAFVELLTERLRQRRDYELVQTWMAVFLRCHAGVVTESTAIRDVLRAWRIESAREAERIGGLVGYVRGVVGWVGGVV